jgi:hypothetical protein
MNNDPFPAAVYAFLDGEGTIQAVEQEFDEWRQTQKLFLSLMQDFGRDPTLLPKIVQIVAERQSAQCERQPL